MLSLGFDSFLENPNSLEAYVETEIYQPTELKELLKRFQVMDFEVEDLEERNWNEEWEKNFEPIVITDKVFVRASFHAPDPRYPIEIVINPKMSFGTGHHDTTSLMVAEQLKLDVQDKRVLDVGTGTGILAILAAKLGAKSVDATDVDGWSLENCVENFEQNNAQNIQVHRGAINRLAFEEPFDIILANINKNVLLDEMTFYAALVKPKGVLVLSGFYEQDNDDLIREAGKNGLEPTRKLSSNYWSCLVFRPTSYNQAYNFRYNV